jgi:hypothetical protein
MPSLDSSQATLNQAIDQCPSMKLRDFIKVICSSSPEVRTRFEKQLLVEGVTTPDSKKRGRDDDATIEEASTKKVKVGRWASCVNCDEDYDSIENGEEACTYHHGKYSISVVDVMLIFIPQASWRCTGTKISGQTTTKIAMVRSTANGAAKSTQRVSYGTAVMLKVMRKVVSRTGTCHKVTPNRPTVEAALRFNSKGNLDLRHDFVNDIIWGDAVQQYFYTI